jgi:threonine synthase
MITGLRCAVCAAFVPIAQALPWRCPNATPVDPYHVLHLVQGGVDDSVDADEVDDPNPFVRYRRRLAWWAFATANGMSDDECVVLTREVAGDFAVTPFERSAVLSEALDVELWVKDETGNVAGSHKARHLASVMLHLRAAEQLGLLAERPPLAIASCGNAAIAAATLARGAGWPLDVYVPTWMSDEVGSLLGSLSARIHRCERRAGDPPGDPAMLRFREAVAGGAIPFTVQGPENSLCLDGGRTLGWEIADGIGAVQENWRIMVQVGGGALAASVGAGLGPGVRLDTVQAEGCAPLADTWHLIAELDQPARYWSQVMRPWPDPQSAADGILDDETYDWIGDVAVMVASGGEPVVASEADILNAHAMAVDAGFDVSATGSAGLAGVLTTVGRLHPRDHVVVVMSGVAR